MARLLRWIEVLVFVRLGLEPISAWRQKKSWTWIAPSGLWEIFTDTHSWEYVPLRGCDTGCIVPPVNLLLPLVTTRDGIMPWGRS